MVYSFARLAAPVVALALAGCMVPPPAPYVPASYASPVGTWGGIYRSTYPAVSSSYHPAIPPVVEHAPQPVALPEPPFEPEAVPAPDEQPIDPSCGWWRLCNLWSGS
jgi:hypothetical protein